MKKFFRAFKSNFAVKPPQDQFYELVLSLLEKQDIATLKRVGDNDYAMGDATISVTYFDPDCFEEMQISLGYELGKGFTVVIRNYVEHLIVINHEILGQFHTIEHAIPPESFMLKQYRKRLDVMGERIMAAVKELPND